MSKLTQFSAPGYLTDFTPENAKDWSDNFVSFWMTHETKQPQVSQFYNEVTSNHTDPRALADITWVAFPNNVAVTHPGNRARWTRADSNRQFMDEYCEWSVQRNESGGIVRVVFTAEGPEYWTHLARLQPETVVELYRKYNLGFDIKKEDLFDANGTYIPNNKWNNSTTTGSIMHLIQVNNTLRAQFHLGGQSTVLRIDSHGRPIRESDRLIRCSRLGGPDRNSDPHIGIQINNIAHNKGLITITDPIGLYLNSFDGSSFHAPDGADVSSFWTWTRGSPADPAKGRAAQWVRAVFEVPKEKGYIVSDIEDQNGNRIQWGAQLADHIQVRLTGQSIQGGMHAAEAFRCLGEATAMATGAKVGGEEGAHVYSDRAEGIVDAGWCCY